VGYVAALSYSAFALSFTSVSIAHRIRNRKMSCCFQRLLIRQGHLFSENCLEHSYDDIRGEVMFPYSISPSNGRSSGDSDGYILDVRRSLCDS
jgi:hypothetical protein